MKAIVTGGLGFIGSHVAEELLEQGHEVVVVDDLSLGKKTNLKAHKNLKVYEMDINEPGVRKVVSGADVVFHLAALPRVQYSIDYPIKTHKANVNGTLNLLNACRKEKVKRFVFSSSCSVYGDQEELPTGEEAETNPMSPYALHKLISEQYCELFNFLYDMETISLRYFNVFGPRQNPEGGYASLIPKFATLILKGERPTIWGDGKQTRDFVYVKDVVRANLLAAETDNKDAFGQVFNVGFGKDFSVNEVTEELLKVSGKEIKPKHGDPVVEPRHTRADTSKIKKYLGWEPEVDFKEGLKETYKYFENKYPGK